MATTKKAEYMKLVEEILELPPGQLTGAEELSTLGWDSLAVVGFLGIVDEKLGIPLSPKLIRGCVTVEDLVVLLDKSVFQ